MNEAAVCTCGRYATGRCVDCDRPVCDDRLNCSRWGPPLRCVACADRHAQATEAAEASAYAERRAVIVEVAQELSSALQAWMAAPTLAPATFAHEVAVDAKRDLAKACPLGHPGCTLRKKVHIDGKAYDGRYECAAWSLHALPGWPRSEDARRGAWLTADGRLIGVPWTTLRGPKAARQLASAKEQEGHVSGLASGTIPLVLMSGHRVYGDGTRPEDVERLRTMVRALRA